MINAQDILDVLTKQRFRDFYEGPFDDWLTGEDDCPDREEILAKISQLFFGSVAT